MSRPTYDGASLPAFFLGSGLAASTFGKSSRCFSCAGVRHCSNFSKALARSCLNGVPARNSINARLK